jgi:hypothetical protein
MHDSLGVSIGESLGHLLAEGHLPALACDLLDEIRQGPSRAKLGDHVVLVIINDVAIVKLEDVGVV